jgi:DNA-binding GntR family transcriptional regulator
MTRQSLRTNNTLYSQVYYWLRDRILNWDIPPGTRLKVEELAQELGVSNTPVREAIRQLTKDGLVETLPYRGSIVKQISPKEVADIYDVRMALEELAVRLAAENATPQALIQIEQCVQQYEKAFHTDDAALGLEADFAFHNLIAEASGNQVLMEVLQSLAARIHALRRIDRGKTRRQASLEDHRAICEALKARDGRRAMEAMIQHIAKGKQHALSLLEQGFYAEEPTDKVQT